jgi:hypothetical protein
MSFKGFKLSNTIKDDTTRNAVNEIIKQGSTISSDIAKLELLSKDIELLNKRISNISTDADTLDGKHGAYFYPYYKMTAISAATKEATGFTNNAIINVAYSYANSTITLTGDFQALWRGEVIPELVSGWTSTADPYTSYGNHFLYYNGSAFVWSETVWTFDMLQIAMVKYVSATVRYGMREPHGFQDWATHRNQHLGQGTILTSGGDIPYGALNGLVYNSTNTGERRPKITPAANLLDEDLPSVVPALTTNSYCWKWFANNATTIMTKTTGNAEFIRVDSGSGRLMYNRWDGSKWVDTVTANNDHVAIFVIAVPVTSDANSQLYRYQFIQAQAKGNLAFAQGLDSKGLNLGETAGLIAEYNFIAKIICKSSSNNWTIISVEKLIGSRVNQTSSPAGSFLSAVTTDGTMITGTGISTSPVTFNVSGLPTTPLTNWVLQEEGVNISYNIPYFDNVTNTFKGSALEQGQYGVYSRKDFLLPNSALYARYGVGNTDDNQIFYITGGSRTQRGGYIELKGIISYQGGDINCKLGTDVTGAFAPVGTYNRIRENVFWRIRTADSSSNSNYYDCLVFDARGHGAMGNSVVSGDNKVISIDNDYLFKIGANNNEGTAKNSLWVVGASKFDQKIVGSQVADDASVKIQSFNIQVLASGNEDYALLMANSIYKESTPSQMTRVTTGKRASALKLADGGLYFLTNATTTAGAITYTEAMVINDAGRVGIGGTVDTESLFRVTGTAIGNIAKLARTGSGTNTMSTSIRAHSISTGTVVDGFGTGLVCSIEGVGLASSIIGLLGFQRSGADNSGAFIIRPYSGGSGTDRLTISPTGFFGINGAVSSTYQVKITGASSLETTGDVKFGAACQVTGFTKLGSVNTPIAVKVLTGTFNSANDNSVSVAHNLTGDKIVSVSGIVRSATNEGKNSRSSNVDWDFEVYWNSTNVTANPLKVGSSVRGKEFVITVIYIE